jgi:hypothetical protein
MNIACEKRTPGQKDVITKIMCNIFIFVGAHEITVLSYSRDFIFYLCSCSEMLQNRAFFLANASDHRNE